MDAPGFSLMSAESTGDPTPGATPTASDGSTGPSTRDTHSVVIAKTDAAGGAARAPLLLIRVFQMNPAGTSEVPGTTGASETRVTPIGPDIVGAQRTVPNAVVQAYGWGLSSDAVAAATSSVSMHRDGSFDVGAPPEGLTTFAVPPSGEPEVANTVGYATAMTEYTSRTQGHATLSVRSGTTAWVQSLQDILSVPSGSDVGSPVVTNRTIMGRPALLRTEVHASGRTSFLAVWEVPDRQATVEIRGSLEAGTEVEATLASIHPVDDETWQEMARRCPGPMHAQGTPPSTAIGSC